MFYRCSGCGGRMISFSVLRKLCADGGFLNLLWRTARDGYAERGPECPVCRTPMRRVTLPLAGRGIELDVCCSCQTVWFDPGELERLPRPADGAAEELPPKVREALAMQSIRDMKEKSHSSDSEEDMPDSGWQYLLAWFGIPVETDAPRCVRLPVVTWGIAASCLLIFALTFTHLQSVVENWGLVPANWMRHDGLTLLTSMFLHGGLGHLIGNLGFLLIFGDNVENEFGRTRYLLLLLAAGFSASALHIAFNPASSVPCIGASGFISGIVACYAVCFPHAKLSFMLIRSLFVAAVFKHNWITIPAWFAFMLWIAFQFLMAHLAPAGGSGVAYLAHIGGAIPGLLLGLIWRGCRSPDDGIRRDPRRE